MPEQLINGAKKCLVKSLVRSFKRSIQMFGRKEMHWIDVIVHSPYRGLNCPNSGSPLFMMFIAYETN